MVAVRQLQTRRDSQPFQSCISIVAVFLAAVIAVWVYYGMLLLASDLRLEDDTVIELEASSTKDVSQPQCPITSISQLTSDETHPQAGPRYMVTPPSDSKLTLACCQTTKGPLSVLLHQNWAPHGVNRLLQMINSGYFQWTVPLFRCTDACQFGLSSNATATKLWNGRIADDALWLPTGPTHRTSKDGIPRYPAGVWTFAGGGPESRSNQFVLTLQPNKFMGGGSPWEVPLGELVGKESFETLKQLYNGYGEKGPTQGALHKHGMTTEMRKEYPLMDYILSCQVLEELKVT